MLNVLILCTGNSARSILAEALCNDPGIGHGRLRGYSAGSKPVGSVNPLALNTLAQHGHRIEGLRSKSWSAFSGDMAPALDVVITVCDSAAGESCPLFNGTPIKAHWGLPDPAIASDEEAAAAFERTYQRLRAAIERLAALPFDNRELLQSQLDIIGESL